jgi:A/G-specific adenine glycosylase
MSETENKDIFELPRVLPQRLLAWYGQNARLLPWRKDTDPYHVWLSEIMLQQTGVEVVKAYYTRFLEAFPTVEALSAADGQKVLKLWEGLGYYSRARNLIKTARLITGDCGGRFPELIGDIAKLPGIGPYTAGAIASICFNQPTPAVDGNVLRVIARVAGIEDAVTDSVKKRIAASLEAIYPADRRGDFTQSLMELGAVVCIPNGAPNCAYCPVSDICAAFRDGTALSLPVKKQKQAKRLQALTVFLLSCGGSLALRRRADSGLLAGLWELPNVPGILDETEAVTLAADWGVRPLALKKASRRSHVFTHVKWDMLCYTVECAAQPPGFTWVSREALSDTYALPTAFKKLLDEA